MTRTSPWFLCGAVLVVGSLAVACGDDGSGGAGGGNNGGGGSGAGPSNADIVMNEVQPHGLEWVEIANAGDSAVDISGFGVCDEDATGACEVGKALRFPEGTTIPAGGYILIMTDQDPAMGPGPHAACTGGVAECYYAQWKVSAVDGETVRVIDASDNEVDALVYPANATADETRSWARLPDLTGDPGSATPTPGAANAP
ncbi:MAG: lamin tail domain-containing protein [Polyangiaceae bacterium]